MPADARQQLTGFMQKKKSAADVLKEEADRRKSNAYLDPEDGMTHAIKRGSPPRSRKADILPYEHQLLSQKGIERQSEALSQPRNWMIQNMGLLELYSPRSP